MDSNHESEPELHEPTLDDDAAVEAIEQLSKQLKVVEDDAFKVAADIVNPVPMAIIATIAKTLCALHSCLDQLAEGKRTLDAALAEMAEQARDN